MSVCVVNRGRMCSCWNKRICFHGPAFPFSPWKGDCVIVAHAEMVNEISVFTGPSYLFHCWLASSLIFSPVPVVLSTLLLPVFCPQRNRRHSNCHLEDDRERGVNNLNKQLRKRCFPEYDANHGRWAKHNEMARVGWAEWNGSDMLTSLCMCVCE